MLELCLIFYLVLEMLKLYIFTTRGCMTSEIMVERLEQAISDLQVEDEVKVFGKAVELNLHLAKDCRIKDVPTIVCSDDSMCRLEGLANPKKIRDFLKEVIDIRKINKEERPVSSSDINPTPHRYG